MKLSGWIEARLVLSCAIGACLLAVAMPSAAAKTGPPANGEKVKIKGTIVSRRGDVAEVQDKKSGEVEFVKIGEDTKIEREKGMHEFFRHENMDVTALVPGLTIEVEGVGNAQGELEAKKIKFNPDIFAIEVAEEQSIQSNQAATAAAQTAADQGVAKATAAQSSADQAQSIATEGVATAEVAGVAAGLDALGIQMVNERVSDLGDYTTVSETEIYFPEGSAVLDPAGKAALDKLASSTVGATGYMIEIAGYASSTGTAILNQRLSEERSEVVAHYLLEKSGIPLRRILVPVGYGTTHPAAPNTDSKGRAKNRRVDVKVLVNNGLAEGGF